MKCRDVRFFISNAFSVGDYTGKLRDVIIEMKHGDEILIYQVGRWLGEKLNSWSDINQFDLIVGIPSFWTRHFNRKINVSSILGEAISKETGLPMYGRLLKQNRPTQKQGTLTRRQRFENVKDVFKVRPSYNVAGRNILLVDDVMTSGATINEAARTLLKNGADRISATIVARGTGSL